MRLIDGSGREGAFAEEQRAIVTAIDHGAKINAVDYMGETALHLAMSRSMLDVAKRLVEKGADVNALDDRGCRAIDNLSIWENNAAHEFKVTPHSAQTFISGVTLLLDAGANLTGNKCNYPAFNLAASLGNAELMTRMLAAGAKIDDYHAIADVAEEKDPTRFRITVESVAFLIQHGANVNASDRSGFAPLVVATMHGNVALRAYLLAHGATLGAMTEPELAKRCAFFKECLAAPRCPAPETSPSASAWICDPEPDGSVYVCGPPDGDTPACRTAVEATTPVVNPPEVGSEVAGGDVVAQHDRARRGFERAIHDLTAPLEGADGVLDRAERLGSDLRSFGAADVDLAKLATAVKTVAGGGDASVESLGLRAGPKAIVASRLGRLKALVTYANDDLVTQAKVLEEVTTSVAWVKAAERRHDQEMRKGLTVDEFERESKALSAAVDAMGAWRAADRKHDEGIKALQARLARMLSQGASPGQTP